MSTSRSGWSRCWTGSSAERSKPSMPCRARRGARLSALRTRSERRSKSTERDMTDIKRVGVLGSGLMGSGIAQVAAAAGYDTTVRDVSQQVWDKARAGIEKSLAKFVEKGKLAAADRDAILKRLRFTTTTADLKT